MVKLTLFTSTVGQRTATNSQKKKILDLWLFISLVEESVKATYISVQ